MRRTVWLLLGLLAIAATAHAADDVPPRRKRALGRWLERRAYAGWVAEPAVHPSLGPHGGNVRTFYNSILADDLRGGAPAFRRNAAMVKELYFAGDTEVVGWAVMRKVARRSGATGRGWLFFEGFPGGRYFGRGVPLCAGCHRDGLDYLLSEFRP